MYRLHKVTNGLDFSVSFAVRMQRQLQNVPSISFCFSVAHLFVQVICFEWLADRRLYILAVFHNISFQLVYVSL